MNSTLILGLFLLMGAGAPLSHLAALALSSSTTYARAADPATKHRVGQFLRTRELADVGVEGSLERIPDFVRRLYTNLEYEDIMGTWQPASEGAIWAAKVQFGKLYQG